jgi:2-polyprenyl-3-methyl-5-hydroxy-6-metoxy-1,4-benzoquinol methylase
MQNHFIHPAAKEERLAQYRASAVDLVPVKNSYGGLKIHALPGLHEYVAQQLATALPKGASVLELGAGTGALSLRMADMGYRVTATDAVTENFRALDRATFIQMDLDREFGVEVGELFDAVVAVEIIEHLENPSHVFRQAAQALKPGGLFLITTPNINNPVSCAMFCRFGHHLWFNDKDRAFHGHITPLSKAALASSAVESGFIIKTFSSYGNPYDHVKNWPKLKFLAKFIDLLSDLPKDLRGEIMLAQLIKA